MAVKWPAQDKYACQPAFIEDPDYTALVRMTVKRYRRLTPWVSQASAVAENPDADEWAAR